LSSIEIIIIVKKELAESKVKAWMSSGSVKRLSLILNSNRNVAADMSRRILVVVVVHSHVNRCVLIHSSAG
jgi:hypothetical protein